MGLILPLIGDLKLISVRYRNFLEVHDQSWLLGTFPDVDFAEINHAGILSNSIKLG